MSTNESQVVEAETDEDADADVVIVAVMFRMGINGKTKEPQLKGSLITDGVHVTIIPSIDSAWKPEDGEIWVCEVDRSKPIATWVYKDRRGGATPSKLFIGNPICQIEVPDEIRFSDVNRRDQVQYIVRDLLPDGKSRVVFVPDRKSENQPERGENWKVEPSMILHTIGVDDDPTIVIAVILTERVTQKVVSSSAQAWVKAGSWSPKRKT